MSVTQSDVNNVIDFTIASVIQRDGIATPLSILVELRSHSRKTREKRYRYAITGKRIEVIDAAIEDILQHNSQGVI